METVDVEQLRQELREVERAAAELRERAALAERRARQIRVLIAKAGHTPIAAPPVDLEAEVRDFAMARDTFTEEQILVGVQELSRKRFREIADRLAADGKMAIIGAGRSRLFVWVRPDRGGTDAPRRVSEDAVRREMQRSQPVAGTGRSSVVSRDPEVRKVVKEAANAGIKARKSNNHVRFEKNGKLVAVTGGTPSGARQHKTTKRIKKAS